MRKKREFAKIGKVILGIATEIMMAVFIMAFALGLSWLLVETVK